MAYLEVYDDDNEQARWPNPRDVQRTPCISDPNHKQYMRTTYLC